MKRRSFIKQSGATGLVALVTPASIVYSGRKPAAPSPLLESFRNPPDTAKPQTWWHWMNGNVTREGITLDLEAMQRIGIGGVQNFDAGTGIPKGPLEYLSPEWLELKKHAIQEAQRLGLEFTIHNCPGWSSSGGPWITPEQSMKQLTWSELCVEGGRPVNRKLPQPYTKLQHYRDVAVLAYPSLFGEMAFENSIGRVETPVGAVDISGLNGEDKEGVTVQGTTADQPSYLQINLKATVEVQALGFVGQVVDTGGGGFGGSSVSIEVSEDGVSFRKLATVPVTDVMSRAEFPSVMVKAFRFVSAKTIQYTGIHFSNALRLTDWRKKANYAFSGVAGAAPQTTPPEKSAIVHRNTLVDLTDKVDATGRLQWDAPAGDWTILRFGYTSTATMNRSAPDTGIGLECDKFSKDAITAHFNKMMEQLLPTLEPLARQGKAGLLIDSYEVGMQNWTDGFETHFRQQNGYDLRTYLPAMTGRFLDSVDTTERFLWDIRRTQADLMADAYYGQFTTLCHQHGLIAYAEPYDRGPMDELQTGSRVDVNMGEFWNGLSTIFQNNLTMHRTVKLAASIAHTNGKGEDKPQVVGAEAFTGEPESARWQEYPFGMKALGDKLFSQGLTRVIFHRYAHQPHPTAQPGMTMGPWGIHFDRTNTWWEQARPWMAYLSRCQSLLQQGLFVADLAYLVGEEGNAYAKVSPDELNPAPPEGYDYDVISAETILRHARMVNNRLTLPDGMSYRVLILQHPEGISLPLLQKIRELVMQGLVIIGQRPARTLGLRDAGKDLEFNRILDQLWGLKSAVPPVENVVGKGMVYAGKTLPDVLKAIKLLPDVVITSRSGDAPVTWIHRRIGSEDVYFLTNQRRTAEEIAVSFRIAGKLPEIWDADTGTVTRMNLYETEDGQTRIPLRLEPAASVFVVFRQGAPENQYVSVSRDQQLLRAARPYPIVSPKRFTDVVNTFTISVWAKPELNIMLSTQNFMDGIADPWTDFYAIYPASGKELYGANHAASGLAIGRNGVAVWERAGGKPVLVLAAPAAISGWSHIAVVYREGAPSVYVNGKLIQRGKASGYQIHPTLDQAFLRDGASCYNGDMSVPQLVREGLPDDRIRQLARERYTPVETTPVISVTGEERASFLFWENGKYVFRDRAGKERSIPVGSLPEPLVLSGSWQVSFPPDRGAPATIGLSELIPLQKHPEPGVRYFSGTATYTHVFDLNPAMTGPNRRIYLDLGRVEVIAEVRLNGKSLSTLWKRPFRLDITDAVKPGTNQLEVLVTNQWPNRLIGDAQTPDVDAYTPGAGGSGFASLSGGAIQQLPAWYKNGAPKPDDGKVTFATWKHYTKESPLLEAGLIGPVRLLPVMQVTI
ncbi:glycosyl hydrolase [Arsenicibacter rosenii]|uniref:Glycosyl hydrolase family 43 n=1 Tax=Arsenicibacter rosenii TaxID=1750698 RepID=A0A1S2VR95_9BACT|nr:glycosyl hydrolase [Arsenicibacter rosenii]OIN60735.1 glycosyl hydrolase family 43 [Arsenicibacter rosenii]